MNKLMLVGRLTKDPEARMAGEWAATKFTIAVDRDRKDKEGNKVTDFIPCDAIGKTAEFINTYLTKGRMVAIEGQLHIDSYVDSDGNNKTFSKCQVQSVQALDSAKNAEAGTGAATTASKPASKPTGKPSGKPNSRPMKKPGAPAAAGN